MNKDTSLSILFKNIDFQESNIPSSSYTFESKITKQNKDVGKDIPVYVYQKVSGNLVYKTVTDSNSTVYVPNLDKSLKYFIVAVDETDSFNSVSFDLNWDFAKVSGTDYELKYHDVYSSTEFEQYQYTNYEERGLISDNNLVFSISEPLGKEDNEFIWSSTGNLQADVVDGFSCFVCSGNTTDYTYLTTTPTYQKQSFTFECYFYIATTITNTTVLPATLFTQSLNGKTQALGINSSGFLYFQRDDILSGIPSINIVSTAKPKYQEWNHAALVFDGTTFKLFLNGVLETQLADTYGMPSVTANFALGYLLFGYLACPTLTKEVKYTDSFSPSYTPVNYKQAVYSDVTDTLNNKVMLKMVMKKNNPQKLFEDIATNTLFKHSYLSTNDYFITLNNSFTVSSQLSNKFVLGNNNFCIEMKCKILSKVTYPTLISNQSTSTEWTTGIWSFCVGHSSYPTKYTFLTYGSGVYQSNSVLVYKELVDLAIVREGNLLKIFINGFLDSTTTITSTVSFDARPNSHISLGRDVTTNIYDFKITTGSNRYSADYVPTLLDWENTEFRDEQYQVINFPFKKVLSDYNSPYTFVNTNIALSFVQSVYETYSCQFNGIDSKIVSSTSNLYFVKETFSIEMFIYPEDLVAQQTILSLHSATLNNFKIGITDGYYSFFNGTEWIKSTYLMSGISFNHIVVTRVGNTVNLLANGEVVLTTTTPDLTGARNIFIGCNSDSTNFFKGFINNLYMYKNHYRFNDAYTVPVIESEREETEEEKEPVVIVNQYTTSALDFEDSLADRVSGTTWIKEGSANTTVTNKLYGTASFGTKNVGDSLYTTSKVISGGAKPFCVEFYGLLKADQSQASSNTFSIPLWLTVAGANSSPIGLLASSPYESSYPVPFTTRISYPLTATSQASVYGNKIEKNVINKYSLSYDGAAFRLFVNDKLDAVAGVYSAFTVNPNTVFSFGANKTTASPTVANCIFDNINIFDGEARLVRNPGPNEEHLIVDLAFDGENNSTKIVDNGTLKSSWTTNGTAKLSTTQKFDGFSSLYLDGNGYLTLPNTSEFLFNNNFTIKMSVIINENLASVSGKQLFYSRESSSSPAIGLSYTGDLYTFNGDGKDHKRRLCMYDNTGMLFFLQTSTTIESNKTYDLTILRKGGVLFLYLNNILEHTLPYTGAIDFSKLPRIGTELTTNTKSNCYIKNFRIYKDVAVIPESPVGKIQLDFDNNVLDTYSNSTWTNNGVTFDQVNSVKGYSAFFGNTNQKIYCGQNLNFNYEKNNFSVNFDIKPTEYRDYPVLLGSNDATNVGAHLSWYGTSAQSYKIAMSESNSNITSCSGGSIYINNYYNIGMSRVNQITLLRINDTIVASRPIDVNTLINFNSNNGTQIGHGWNNSYSGNKFIGFIDNFSTYKEDLLNINTIIYKSPNVNMIVENESVYTSYNGNPTGTSYGTMVFNDCPIMSNFIAELEIFIKSDTNNHGILNFRTTDYSLNNMDKFGYSAYISGGNIKFGKGSNSNTSSWTEIATLVMPTKFQNNDYHTMKVIANGSNFKIFLDNELMHDVTDTTYSYATKFGWCTYLVNNWNGVSSRIRSIKISDLSGNELYYKDWKTKIDNVIDKAAVHLPLETNSNNIGFTPLTINSVGSPTYATIDNKKCIKFESGKYLSINSNNIFNLGSSSDFYIEFDFYPTVFTSTNGIGLFGNFVNSSGSVTSGSTYVEIRGTADTTNHKKIMVYYRKDSSNIYNTYVSSNEVTFNQFNNLIIKRKNNTLSIVLNEIEVMYQNVTIPLDFSTSNTVLGQLLGNNNTTLNGYMSNFKIFVGTSEIPETYHDKKVLNLDFKPTRKSYLFKDKNNKCIIHPVNITQRDYQDSMYCCTFNGTNQYLELGKNDSLNFGLDDFVISFKLKFETFQNYLTVLSGYSPTGGVENTSIMIVANKGASSTVNTNSIHFKCSGVVIFNTPETSIIPNIVNDIIIYRLNGVFKLVVNGNLIDSNTTNINLPLNFNFSGNTLIGKVGHNLSENYKGQIYSVKVLRNTTDISLLEDYKKPVAPIVKDERGVWILDTATWTSTPAPYASSSMMRYNPTLLTDPVWTVLHSNTFDFSIRTYKSATAGPVLVSDTTSRVINKSPLNKKFYVHASNGTWQDTTVNADIEFLDNNDNVIMVLRWERDSTFRHGIWYGSSWSSLTKAPQSGSYPQTYGVLYFKPNELEFYSQSSSTAGLNQGFTFSPPNYISISKIRVTKLGAYQDYTGGSGANAFFNMFLAKDLNVEKSVDPVIDIVFPGVLLQDVGASRVIWSREGTIVQDELSFTGELSNTSTNSAYDFYTGAFTMDMVLSGYGDIFKQWQTNLRFKCNLSNTGVLTFNFYTSSNGMLTASFNLGSGLTSATQLTLTRDNSGYFTLFVDGQKHGNTIGPFTGSFYSIPNEKVLLGSSTLKIYNFNIRKGVSQYIEKLLG